MKNINTHTFIIMIFMIIGMFKISNAQQIDIYGNVVWNTPQEIIQPVIIHSNAILTITAGANFDFNAYVEVQSGGRLIVQNCTLSSYMTPLWPSIILCGVNNDPQQLSNQGMGKLLLIK